MMNFASVTAFFQTDGGDKKRLVLCGCLLIALLLLPIRMNVKGNEHFPGLASIEASVSGYCAETLPKIVAAFAFTRGVTGVLSVVEDIHIPVINTAPGKALSGMQDAVRELGSVLLTCIGIVTLGTFMMSILTFFCFKLLLPAALALRILHECRPATFAWAARVSSLLAKTAILAWLFLPTVALVNGYVEAACLNEQYSEQMRSMEAGMATLQGAADSDPVAAVPPEEAAPKGGGAGDAKPGTAVQPEETAPAAQGTAEEDQSSFWDRGKTMLGEATNSARQSLSEAGAAVNPLTLGKKMAAAIEAKVTLLQNATKGVVDRLIKVVVMFVLTTMVIPVAIFLLFILIFRQQGNAPLHV